MSDERSIAARLLFGSVEDAAAAIVAMGQPAVDAAKRVALRAVHDYHLSQASMCAMEERNRRQQAEAALQQAIFLTRLAKHRRGFYPARCWP